MDPISTLLPTLSSALETKGLPQNVRGSPGQAPFSLEDLGKIEPAPQPRVEKGNLSIGGSGYFDDVLKHFVGEVSAKGANAGQKVAGVMRGEGVPLHQAMISMQESGVAFQLMVEVRNRLLESYQELMRMQV